MNTNQTYYPFYMTDVPQQEMMDPKDRKHILILGIVNIVIFFTVCLFI